MTIKMYASDIICPPINPEEEKWETLINQIIAGNVIPVIGSSILVDGNDICQMAINILSTRYGIENPPTSFSQLIYDKRFPESHRDSIYGWLDAFCIQNKNNLQPSKLLERILSIRYFPFVITTSFFPIVENTMKKIWGENVRTLVFDDDPSHVKINGRGDIADEEDVNSPTVYYMFGKHTKSVKRFVVTDADMLKFCKSWLTEELRPPKLSGILKNKYLLMLGNNYQDWLFRFIWYFMNHDAGQSNKSFDNIQGMVVNNVEDDSLVQFLNRIQTFTQNDPAFVISKIENELSKKCDDKFDAVRNNVDVFISYSRREKKIADALYDALTKEGLNVWYDKYNLFFGNKWMDDIRGAIETAKFFVPILSKSIVNEKREFHPYRQEWGIALNMLSGYARTYICPVLEKGFDYEEAKANTMKDIHAYEYENPIFETFAIDIAKKVKELNKN